MPAGSLVLHAQLQAFFAPAESDCQALRNSLTEVLMAQDYQGLTWPVSNPISDLGGQVEKKGVELVSACGVGNGSAVVSATTAASSCGPALREANNIVGRKADVDELLNNLGF